MPPSNVMVEGMSAMGAVATPIARKNVTEAPREPFVAAASKIYPDFVKTAEQQRLLEMLQAIE